MELLSYISTVINYPVFTHKLKKNIGRAKPMPTVYFCYYPYIDVYTGFQNVSSSIMRSRSGPAL